MESEKKIKLIIITGAGHSGTTLLDIILDNHSQIIGLGECEKFGPKLTHNIGCACGAPFETCSLWSDFLIQEKTYLDKQVRDVRRKGLDTLLGRKKYMFKKYTDDNVTLEEYVRHHENLYAYVQEKTGCVYVADSTKNPTHFEVLARYSNKLDIHVIHLVRDGRAVTWSYFKRYQKMLMYMKLWCSANIKVMLIAHRMNLPRLVVHYTDVSTQPEETLQKICDYLHIPFEKEMLNLRSSVHHQVGGNQGVLFGKTAEIRPDIEWKTKMPKKWQWIFLILFGWMNTYYYLRARK